MANYPVPKIEKTWVDRGIEKISPSWGIKRFRSKQTLAMLESFTGASRTRRALKEWMTWAGSPNADLTWDLPTLRSRSRDLDRNNPIARGAKKTKIINVVGTGLKLQARIDRDILSLTEEECEAWESHTEKEWSLFWETADVDIAKTLNGHELTKQVYDQTLVNGDVLVLFPRTLGRNPNAYPYSLRLQLIEGDRLSNENGTGDTETLTMGVEKDANGAPSQYHIQDQHPGDLRISGRTWKKIPAFGSKTGLRNVLHIFHQDRPGQSRGVPDLAPVIEALKQLGRYTEAELMAAVISSFFTVFVKSETGDAELNPMAPTGDVGGSTSDEDYKLGQGAIVGLNPNESIDTANPGRPNPSFNPFIQAICEQIGAAIGLPYEVLVKHFTASYSAARAALIDAWRYFISDRVWLANAFNQQVYEIFLYEAISLGRISAPGFFRDPLIRKAYTGAKWIGAAMGQIDPMKEVDAARERLDLGLTTLDEETVSLTGGDFADNYPRIAKEREMLKEIGMWIPKAEKQPVTNPAGPEPQDKNMDQGDTENQ